MPSTIKCLILSLLAGSTVAAPAVSPSESEMVKRQMTIPSCYKWEEYKDLEQSKPYYDKWQRVGGYECTSLKKSGCSISKSASHTVGVTKTVSGGGSAGIDLGKINSLGIDAGFSYSWSTSDSTTFTDTNQCPPGGLTCGLQVSPQLVKITGTYIFEMRGGCDRKEKHPFKIYAPVEKGGGKNKDQSAVQNFKICLAKPCKDETCKKAAKAEGIEKCP